MSDNRNARKINFEKKKGVTGVETQEILRGKAFQIYWYLLTQGEAGVRELQRELGFSSPNVAVHHLKKLSEAELVWQNPSHGKYELK